jgi:hypothetical protein
MNSLKLFTLGFLTERWQEEDKRKFEPSGSGVLVEIGGVKGAITAAHVFRKLRSTKTADLVTITNGSGRSIPIEFATSSLKCVFIGGPDWSHHGPDLAFVRLPADVEQRLALNNAFYNFDRRTNMEDAPLTREILCGVVAEWSKPKELKATTRIDTHTMIIAPGRSTSFRDNSEGFDLFDFEIDHDDDVVRPQSYGGLSGSAIWRTSELDRAQDRLLVGIAFWQSDSARDGSRSITCHGPKSIYQLLAPRVCRAFAR